MSGYIAGPMSDSKKRRWIRDPLTEEEIASGQSYYSETDIESIFQSFKHRSDLDKAQFARRLKDTAFWFVSLAAAGKGEPPSTLQRKWEHRAKKIKELIAEFERLGGREKANLEYAAEQLAQRMGELPDLTPDKIELPPVPGADPSPSDYLMVWPVEEQLRKSIAALEWLHQCVNEAGAQAGDEKAKGGNRPIEPKHAFYRDVVGIYDEAALAPKNPQKDRIRGDVYGEVLDFLEACLRPLGVCDTRKVIYKTYYRAGAKLTNKSRR